MNRHLLQSVARLGIACSLAAVLLMTPGKAEAQGQWRVGVATGGYVAPSPLIKAADSRDTHLTAGPTLALDAAYLLSEEAAIYANGLVAAETVQLGSSISPAVIGSSSQVTLFGGTAGAMLTGFRWLGDNLHPTLRLGGGLKWYRFGLSDAENQVRPTMDIGLGLRGIGAGLLEGTAEVRYLLSSFDQGKLPTRGIAPQEQRQNDIVFSIGIGMRP